MEMAWCVITPLAFVGWSPNAPTYLITGAFIGDETAYVHITKVEEFFECSRLMNLDSPVVRKVNNLLAGKK